jgi:hypothetical protein
MSSYIHGSDTPVPLNSLVAAESHIIVAASHCDVTDK